jgi:hypothetical protein
MAGVPLSVTRTVKLGDPADVGVQVKAPLVELMLAPAGAPTRLKVRLFPPPGSVADAVKVRVEPTLTVLFPIVERTGAWLGGGGGGVDGKSFGSPGQVAALISCMLVNPSPSESRVSFAGNEPL